HKLGEVLKGLGVDVSTSGGNQNILRKMAQAMFNTNGREITGGVDERGAWYGVGEKGIGRLNTIHGDPVLGAYQLIDILVKHLVKSGEMNPANFSSRKIMNDNAASVKSIGEALAHLTTERITMLEAMQLMGSHNIVGYTGTAKGLSRAMLQSGKQITTISDETIIKFNEVKSGEVHFSVKLGNEILTLEKVNGKLRLVQTTGKNYEAYLLDQARGKMEAGYTQQVFTHNDNTVLGRMALELANKYGVERIEISNATVEAHFRQMAPELTRGLDWGKEADRPAAMEIAIKDMLSGRSSKPQVIEINGMSPESYQRAIEAVSDAIHYTPKMGDVLKMADGLGAGAKASLERFVESKGGVEKASVGEWLRKVADTYGKARSEALMAKLNCGWTQERYIFAPAIGEGLNIFGAVRGLSNEMQFQGRLVKMDLSPSDVFAQAMKRGNVVDETTGAIKRVNADTGLNLNLDTINGIKDVERGRFRQFLEDVNAGKIDLRSEKAQRQFFALFDVMMRDFLVEIDTAKAGEVARTQAGELPRTDAVTVQKGSPEYMRAMADRITKDLPGRLREFQGLADLSASWNRQTPGSLLTRMPGMPAALKQTAGWSRIPALAALFSGAGIAVNAWQSLRGALKTDGQQLALVKNLAQAWKNPEVLALAARITELKASQPAAWLEILAAEKLPEQAARLKKEYGQGWARVALAEHRNLESRVATAEQVAGYQAQYGEQWHAAALQERLGPAASFYQQINNILEAPGVTRPFRLGFAVWNWNSPSVETPASRPIASPGWIVSETRPAAAVKPAGGSILQRWLTAVGDDYSGTRAVEALTEIWDSGEYGAGKTLSVAPAASHRGFVHLLAALLSFMPAVVLQSDALADIRLGPAIGRADVVADVGPFFDSRLEQSLVRQLTGIAEKVLWPQQSPVRQKLLRQLDDLAALDPRWKAIKPENRLAAYLEAYLLEGETLRPDRREGQDARPEARARAKLAAGVWETVRQAFGGRSFDLDDLDEFASARGALEVEAADLAERIRLEQDRNTRALLAAQFEETVGVPLREYRRAHRPALGLRLLRLLVKGGQLRAKPEEALTRLVRTGYGLAAAAGILTLAAAGLAAAPVILAAGAGVTLACLAGASLLHAQASDILWALAPAASLERALSLSRIPGETLAERAAFSAELLTPRTRQAMERLLLPGGRGLIQEGARNQIMDEFFRAAIRIADPANPLSARKKERQLHFVFGELMAALHVPMELEVAVGPEGALQAQVTPTQQPSRQFLTDRRLDQSRRTLEGLGIKMNIRYLLPNKPIKQKATGRSA
ncbi:MAG: hypothetical protein AB1439_12795, partial [candidate division FCPU426 bacterium]